MLETLQYSISFMIIPLLDWDAEIQGKLTLLLLVFTVIQGKLALLLLVFTVIQGKLALLLLVFTMTE